MKNGENDAFLFGVIVERTREKKTAIVRYYVRLSYFSGAVIMSYEMIFFFCPFLLARNILNAHCGDL